MTHKRAGSDKPPAERDSALAPPQDSQESAHSLRRLVLSEEMYRKAFFLTPDAMNITRLEDGMYVSVNHGFTQITGYEESDVIGKTSLEVDIWVHAEDRARLVQGLKTDGMVINLDAQFRTKRGFIIDGLMSAAVIRLGEVPHIISVTSDITDRKNAETQLQRSEEKYRQLANDLPAFIVTYLPGGVLTFANQAIAKLVGMEPPQLVGLNFLSFLNEFDRQVVQKRLSQLTPQQPVEAHEQTYVGPAGEVGYHQWTNRAFFDAGGVVTHFQAVGEDITERKLAAEEMKIAATAFESRVGIAITNAKLAILKTNKAFTDITGYSAQEVVGKTPKLLSSGRHGPEFYAEMWQSITQKGTWEGEIWNRRKGGEVFPEWLTITAVRDGAGVATHYVGTFTDNTLRKVAEDQIKTLAFYDPLTQLPNRRLLMDRLAMAQTNSSRRQHRCALLFVDLDNFKTINDTVGHQVGDRLLEEVARRLSHCVREGDTVARLGGDEFVVMLEDLSLHELDAATQAEAIGEKILRALDQVYEISGHRHYSTASIGVTLFGSVKNESIDEPLKRADMAMYQAKAAGRNALRFFDPNMQAVVAARAELEAGLRKALDQHQLVLHYQPQVSKDHRVLGVEALVRWKHPQRGIVSPSEFIPLAEETGLILPLGDWVLRAACAQLVAWSSNPDTSHLTVAVNVSARQFHQEKFAEQVLAVLDQTGADPRLLKLELTESLLVTNVEGVIAKMNKLKSHGVCFSLDDFGTGYSSLSYLKRLPLDQLKIDQGFVRNILSDPNDAAISKMVILLAESLGLDVIAEGVETQAQEQFLHSQGCRFCQGYLFSQPLQARDLEAYLHRFAGRS
ncbi:EAL domain-containing protein [Rhodoferax sp. GW822-FHT02A01]|uniref:sensor domain-containing protein n=1 Tax=Rhodoferax sp. GW822-FHT02A01 TaxID=3141537 RepID=UPI00315CE27B